LLVVTAKVLRAKIDQKRPFCVFEPPPLWGLWGNIRWSS